MHLVRYLQDIDMMYQYGRHIGRYRKQIMKRGYCKALYNQRNKDETIISVIKRLFGKHITSRLVGKNTEHRIIIQVYLQYPQIN
jgi:hypothetical protein